MVLAYQDLIARLRDWAGCNHDPSAPVNEAVALMTEAADLIETWGETVIPDYETQCAMLEARNKELEAAENQRDLFRAACLAASIKCGLYASALEDSHSRDAINLRTIEDSLRQTLADAPCDST